MFWNLSPINISIILNDKSGDMNDENDESIDFSMIENEKIRKISS